ncbi:MAG TPA: fumarylacetoacetate hydrolase family protein [Pedococcus sp.]|nr:fumarylacetoacetate hydrolase family protein [Pedococcus sp.]
MEQPARTEAATRLLAAYETKEAIAPLTATYEGMNLDDAYAIQLIQLDALIERGRTVRGHKVGLTSVAMQELLGVDQPDYGHVLDDFFHAEHEPIPITPFLQPRIEPEIGFVLKAPLRGPGVTVDDAIAAIDYVVPSLEIVDSRIKDWKIALLDTIADNASSGAVVLGATHAGIHDVDLALSECVFTRNGEVVGTGAGSAVLGSPVNALVWLANTVGARGVALEAGHVILPGAVCAMVPVEPGDTFTATFSGLGSVTATFSTES